MNDSNTLHTCVFKAISYTYLVVFRLVNYIKTIIHDTFFSVGLGNASEPILSRLWVEIYQNQHKLFKS